MNKRKFKKITSLSFALGIVATVPAILSSCSISSSLLEEYVPKGTGLQIASGDNYSLTDLTKYSLSTNTGMEKWFKQLVNQSILQWYQKLGSDSSQSSDKAGYARKLASEKESINDSYDSTYDSTSASNGTEKNYLFQQNELDPNGGTIDSWKKQKWLDWASSNFESDLFANLYLSLVDSSGNWVKTTYDNLNSALSTTSSTNSSSSGISFKFSANALKGTSSASKDTYVNNEYANFQQFIFDQWVQSENPFIINYDKWTYGTPSEGLDTIYNADAIGKTSTSTTTIAGSYAFPYFSNAADNGTYSDVNKFIQFVTTAKSSGIADSNDTAGTYGLTDINKNNYSGDTSASYKLVTNATSYSDLNASLALGATYLFSTAYTDSSSSTSTVDSSSGTTTTASSTGVNYTSRNKLSKNITTTSSGPFDAITSNFISSSQDSFKNGSLNSGNGASTIATSSDSYITSTQLSNDLVQKVLSTNAYTKLTSANKSKETVSSPTLYSIDAFIPNETNLKNVLFLRDTDGVYAITLDGEAYISKATSLSDAKTRAGNIVLYRYLESKMPSGAVSSTSGLSSIDLLSTLKTFYESNRDWLIYEYAQSKSSSTGSDGQSLFDFSFITSNSNAQAVLNDISAYYYILNRYQRLQSYQEAAYKVKSTYSSNYGTVANKNGLAAQFPYEFTDASSSSTTQKATTSSIGYYSQLSTLKIEQPSWWSTSTNSNSIDWNNPNSTNGIYSTLMTAISTYVSSLSISPLTSSFAGFKYSQYIYTDDFFLNQAILAVGSDGNLLSDMIKKNVLESSINGSDTSSKIVPANSYISADSYTVSNIKDSSGGDSNTDVSSYINSALSNYFFNSTFDSSSNKWVGLQQTFAPSYSPNNSTQASSKSVITTSTLPTIKYTDLDTYRRNMWLSSNLTSTGTTNDNYVNFLTLIATIQYLNANDGAKFMEQLRNKISTTDGTNLAFLVWESSVDKNLDNSTSFASAASNSATSLVADANASASEKLSDSAKTLLYGSDGTSVVTNVDNSQATSYYPNNSNSGSYVDKNNNNSTFTDSSLTSNYYTHVSKMHGFQGIQTSSSSSNISSTLSDALFTSPSLFSSTTSSGSSVEKATSSDSSGTGLLYGIASSRDKLETVIKGYSSSQVDSLAQLIQKYYGVDVSSVLSADGSIITNDGTTAKQTALINIIKADSSSSPKVPDNAFTPRRGYVNDGNLYKETNQSVTNVNYGSYVIQLSDSDLTDKNTFISTLKSTFETYDPSVSGAVTTTATNSNATNEAASLYWNLLVQFATDSSIQDTALSNILSNNKINVFDVRLNNQLGSKWVINYKEQSSS